MRILKFSLIAITTVLAGGALADGAGSSASDSPAAEPTAIKIDVRCKSGDCLRFGWEAYDHGSGITARFTCVGNDCATNGWNYRASLDSSRVKCKAGGCFVTGWTERQTLGLYKTDVTCRKPAGGGAGACWKYGWDADGTRGKASLACDSNDCARFGGTTTLPNGSTAVMRCMSDDCLHVGYTITQ